MGGRPADGDQISPYPRPRPLPEVSRCWRASGRQVEFVRKSSKTIKPLLGITMGDPAGIGPEVIVKALARPGVRRLCRPLAIGSPAAVARTVRGLKAPLKVRSAHLAAFEAPAGVHPVLDP